MKGNKVRNPARYRLDFIAENTFNRVWSIRLTRAKVVLASAAVIAALAALVFVAIVYTPIGRYLPIGMQEDVRTNYLDAAIKLDSLENVIRRNDAYLGNILTILSDTEEKRALTADTSAASGLKDLKEAEADSLLRASEAEKRFVRQYEAGERFNLSVLAPIAAEGMVFYSPSGSSVRVEDDDDTSSDRVTLASGGRVTAATAVYSGTVVGVYSGASGFTILVQHPNDFISVYSGLGEVFVGKGRKVSAGQRIGHCTDGRPLSFELWHSGSPLNPREYISF